MRKLLALLFFVPSLCLAQSVTLPYNPDANADSTIGAPDLLELLPLFGGQFTPNAIQVDGQTLELHLESLELAIEDLAETVTANTMAIEQANEQIQNQATQLASLGILITWLVGDVSTTEPNVGDIIRRILTLDYSDLNLEGAELSDADLAQSNLSGSNLGLANLTGAELEGCNAANALFNGASLNGADMINGDFTGADFGFADLTDANIGNSDFTGADFTSANLGCVVITPGPSSVTLPAGWTFQHSPNCSNPSNLYRYSIIPVE